MADWLPELTDDDLGTLIDALEAWESKDQAGEMLGDVLGAMLTRDDPRAKHELEQRMRSDQLMRDRAKGMRKERSVMLRAKLLTLRNRRRVDSLIAEAPK